MKPYPALSFSLYKLLFLLSVLILHIHVSATAAVKGRRAALAYGDTGAGVSLPGMASGADSASEDGSNSQQAILLKDGGQRFHKALPIVDPDSSHTHLMLAREGIAAISRIKTPIAAVSVIGPYRSGKSFLLNQLLSLSCNEGFGVGHARDTKTKGVWVWGEPMEAVIDGRTVSVIFIDTEGFESLGKSTVYDDRIFALAAILSSVLIYNLPETVKEADIAKLSFAVELADEFYGRVKGRTEAFNPAQLLWLIQRDFLEGKTVQEMVADALQPVPNPTGDTDIEQVNRIRNSLSIMAGNSTAFGLTQPHLMRTKLCEMTDGELDPKYVRQRDELKGIVANMVKPKIVSGHEVSGEEFVSLLEQTLEALNKGKIPSAGSVVDVFNQAVTDKCVQLYQSRMDSLALPLGEERLTEAHGAAAEAARLLFEKERFGHTSLEQAGKPLEAMVTVAFEKTKQLNAYMSSQQCEHLYAECEDQVEGLQNMRIPSMAKFDAGVTKCNISVERSCLGPSKHFYQERLQKLWTRERAQFLKEYNQRLFNWLVVSSLVSVVVSRFVLKSLLLEVGSWGLFVFLETYTRIFFSTDTLYYNAAWRTFVSIWEAIVFNPLIDLNMWLIPLAWMGLVLVVVCRCYQARRRAGATWGSSSSSSSHVAGRDTRGVLLPLTMRARND